MSRRSRKPHTHRKLEALAISEFFVSSEQGLSGEPGADFYGGGGATYHGGNTIGRATLKRSVYRSFGVVGG